MGQGGNERVGGVGMRESGVKKAKGRACECIRVPEKADRQLNTCSHAHAHMHARAHTHTQNTKKESKACLE